MNRLWMLITAIALVIVGAVVYGNVAAGATGVPYCSAQDEPAPEALATETVDQDVYEPACKPIPEPSFQDHVCGFQGFTVIPDHHDRKVTYTLDGETVDAGQHTAALGAEIHVEAEVRGDGNDEADATWHFLFATPDCTGTPGTPGEDGEPGEDGQDGTPGLPAPPSGGSASTPAPAVPRVQTPQFTG